MHIINMYNALGKVRVCFFNVWYDEKKSSKGSVQDATKNDSLQRFSGESMGDGGWGESVGGVVDNEFKIYIWFYRSCNGAHFK